MWVMEATGADRLRRATRPNPAQLFRQRNHALPRPRSSGSKRSPPNLSRNRSACDGLAKQKTMYVTSSRRTVWLRGYNESPRQNSWITALFAPLTRSAGNATWCGHSRSIAAGSAHPFELSSANVVEIVRHIAECLEDYGFFELAKAGTFDTRQRHRSGVRLRCATSRPHAGSRQTSADIQRPLREPSHHSPGARTASQRNR